MLVNIRRALFASIVDFQFVTRNDTLRTSEMNNAALNERYPRRWCSWVFVSKMLKCHNKKKQVAAGNVEEMRQSSRKLSVYFLVLSSVCFCEQLAQDAILFHGFLGS